MRRATPVAAGRAGEVGRAGTDDAPDVVAPPVARRAGRQRRTAAGA